MALIFVVDDEPLLLNLVSTMLRSDGHEVRSATDAEGAIKAIRASQPPVELIITDTDMKPLSGPHMVKQLHRMRIKCPVLFMSGNHGIAGMLADAAHSKAVIEKPFTATVLRLAIHKSLAAQMRKTHRATLSPESIASE